MLFSVVEMDLIYFKSIFFLLAIAEKVWVVLVQTFHFAQRQTWKALFKGPF